MEKIIRLLEKKFNCTVDSNLGKLVNFSSYKENEFQRWVYYQEGFSPYILDWFINYKRLNTKNKIFFDPFCGAGTSLIRSKQIGMKAVGIELNPFSFHLSKVKSVNYTKKELEFFENYKLPKFKKIENVSSSYELSIINNLFTENNLIKIELIKRSLNSIKSKKIREIIKTTLLCVLEKTSKYKKSGNGLKKRKKDLNLDVYEEFQTTLIKIINDLRNQKSKSNVKVYNSDIRNINNLVSDNSFDISLFSPPYVNCFDYFEVYKIELWLGGFINSYKEIRQLRKKAITSNLNANLKQNLKVNINSTLFSSTLNLLNKSKHWDKKIPLMVDLYFKEMSVFYSSLYKKMKKNGKVAVVVGNSAYAGIPVLTDLIMAEIINHVGFKINEIIVARKNETSSQQYKKIGNKIKYIRESIIIFEK